MSYILSGVSIFTDKDLYKNPDYHPLSNIQHQRGKYHYKLIHCSHR